MDAQRILVVDDEPRITDLVSMALRYEGFEVETAGTGRAGLKAVEDFRPALIVLDVMLPDMDGFAVTERLTADRVKVPVLFLTARDAVEDKVRGLTLGGDDYVTKPFSIETRGEDTLLRRTESVTEGRTARLRGPGLDDGTHEVATGTPVDLTATGSDWRGARSERAARPVEGADPGPRVALRLRRRREHRGDVRELPPAEDRRARAADDPHRARRRLSAERAADTGRGVST